MMIGDRLFLCSFSGHFRSVVRLFLSAEEIGYSASLLVTVCDTYIYALNCCWGCSLMESINCRSRQYSDKSGIYSIIKTLV